MISHPKVIPTVGVTGAGEIAVSWVDFTTRDHIATITLGPDEARWLAKELLAVAERVK